ncbi:MAG: peptidoglycan DD-metalloendopeptidase family protein [Patescibacteria group bacterium]
MRYLNGLLVAMMLWCAHLASGCCGPECLYHSGPMPVAEIPEFTGGGTDAIMADLPFAYGYPGVCTQGARGTTSHNARSTMFDVDLDTSNTVDVPLFAPVGGLAYVHDDDRTGGFGVHINIDQGDGTYLILGHMETVFIDNLSEVAAGQLLGFEGTTGYSSGDHVHYGRHQGDASLDGVNGQSVDGLILDMENSPGDHVQLMTSDMWCALPGGQMYSSLLETPLWHPNGSLVQVPGNSTIYLVENDQYTPFLTEEAFTSRNYSFSDVVLISDSERVCYGQNAGLSAATEITAVFGAFPNQAVWLLVGELTDPDRYRLLVPDSGWQAVLKSWGITAATYNDLYHEPEESGLVQAYDYAGAATFRDGSLISAVEDSAVYVMSDGVAQPVQTWEAFLLAGWEDREVIEMRAEELMAVATMRGTCVTDTMCLTRTDLITCGGPQEVLGGGGINADIAEGDDLVLTWFTPDDETVDAITLRGATTRLGQPEGAWGSVFNEVQNINSVTVTVTDLVPGDSFRFSAEVLDDGLHSWSCLAPYPPGQVRGSLIATYQGDYLGYTTVEDPLSPGCGLKIVVP